LCARPLTRSLRTQGRVPAELLQRVQPRELLPNVRIVALAEFLGELDHASPARGTTAAGAAGSHLPDVVADPVPRLTCDRSRERIARAPAATGTQSRALGHERRVRGGPAVVEPTDDVVVARACAVDEHLVEQCAARHLPQRTDLDARLRHVELEVRDAFVLGKI